MFSQVAAEKFFHFMSLESKHERYGVISGVLDDSRAVEGELWFSISLVVFQICFFVTIPSSV